MTDVRTLMHIPANTKWIPVQRERQAIIKHKSSLLTMFTLDWLTYFLRRINKYKSKIPCGLVATWNIFRAILKYFSCLTLHFSFFYSNCWYSELYIQLSLDLLHWDSHFNNNRLLSHWKKNSKTVSNAHYLDVIIFL